MRFTITHGASAPVDPEREPEDRPEVVLELARLRAVDRPVASVVHARRELVRQQPPLDLEELHREHADIAELLHERGAELLGVTLRSVARRGASDAENPVAMDVLAHRPEPRLPVASAHTDDRELAVEPNDLLR